MNIREKIKHGHYNNHFEHPAKPIKKCFMCNKAFKSDQTFCQNCGNNVKDRYNNLYGKYKDELKKYGAENLRLDGLFRQDAIAECSILDHPKAKQCFALAYEYGHSNGLEEILNYLKDLSELLK